MKTDYTKFTDKELEEKIKELVIRLQRTYGFVKKGEKKESRKNLKKEIARLKTELNKRK